MNTKGELCLLSIPIPQTSLCPTILFKRYKSHKILLRKYVYIRESNFNAISYGNEALQKVLVLVLSKYEDGEDFKEIIGQLDQMVMEFEDPEELKLEIKRIYELSQSVLGLGKQ